MTRLNHRHVLIVILVAHLLLAGWYSLAIPLGEAPDEADHYAYVVFVGTQRALPEGPAITQGKHPPLYYLMGAALTAWTGLDFSFLRANPDVQLGPDAIYKNHFIHTGLETFPWHGGALAMHLLRFLSVILSTVTVWAVYALARVTQPDDSPLALAATGLAAFLPGFLFSSASVSNDVLAAMFGTLALWLALRAWRRGATWGNALALGACLGLGAVSKVGVLAVWPVAALALVLPAPPVYPGRRSWRQRLVGLLLAFVPALLILTPWMVRNVQLYGDPFGWALVRATVDVRSGPVDLAVLDWLARGLFISFWGKFGPAGQIVYPDWLYLVCGIATLAALVGLVLGGLRLLRQRTWSTRLVPWGLLLLAIVLSLVTLIQYTGIALGTDQARLLWPVIGPLAILVTAGWQEMGRRLPRPLPLAPLVTAGLFVLALLIPIFLLSPAYGRPAPLAAAGLEPANGIRFGDDLVLLDATVDPARQTPGQPVTVTLTWRAARDIPTDLRVTTALHHPDDGVLLVDHSNSPAGGRWSTDHWRAGDVYRDQVTLTTPVDGVRPSRYDVWVQVRPFGGGDTSWLPVAGAGQEGPAVRLPDGVVVAQAGAGTGLGAPTPVLQTVDARFASGLSLRGVDRPAELQPGEPFTVTLAWTAVLTPTHNATFFVHLVGPGGTMIAQDDRQPAGGSYPTSIWRPGDGSTETMVLDVPPDLPAGTYTLWTGLYPAAGGPNDPALNPDGTPAGERLRLAEYEIERTK